MKPLWTGRATSQKLWCMVALGAILTGTLAFSYGPPRLFVRIMNAKFQSETNLIAVAVNYEKNRPPTGFFNTFPNGGTSKVLEKEARVYLCDPSTSTVKKLASFKPSSRLESGFRPWIIGWKDNAIVVRLVGMAGESLADYKAGLNTEVYLVDFQGNIKNLAKETKLLSTAEPSVGHDTI
jgi:hypothetical protein